MLDDGDSTRTSETGRCDFNEKQSLALRQDLPARLPWLADAVASDVAVPGSAIAAIEDGLASPFWLERERETYLGYPYIPLDPSSFLHHTWLRAL